MKEASFVLNLLLLMSYSTLATPTMNGFNRILKILDDCQNKTDTFKCLKIQAVKVVERASSLKNLHVLDGVDVVKISNTTGRSFLATKQSRKDLETLTNEEVNSLLWTSVDSFFTTHALRFSTPKSSVGEARRKKNKYMWPLMAALAIKGVFMAISYKGVAAMAGAALIIGKMALLLSAILGLKKLVNQGGEGKTTFEIVKHPHHTQTHSFSSSFEHEHDGSYHRSMTVDDMLMLEKIYQNQIPKY